VKLGSLVKGWEWVVREESQVQVGYDLMLKRREEKKQYYNMQHFHKLA